MVVQWYSGSGSVQSQWVLVAKNSVINRDIIAECVLNPEKGPRIHLFEPFALIQLKKKVPFGKSDTSETDIVL